MFLGWVLKVKIRLDCLTSTIVLAGTWIKIQAYQVGRAYGTYGFAVK